MVQEGLFQIGAQAYHILVREPGGPVLGLQGAENEKQTGQAQDQRPLLVLIPTQQAATTVSKNYLIIIVIQQVISKY
ncbi:hypothetical protein O3M35_001627 [Rhynocoris fuscipes]|uniref:Uncharacterized protein n=1 Tax=Rhynocoris fuscipes TaxID=488301 RepID=A0AAW1CN60_9HEMI